MAKTAPTSEKASAGKAQGKERKPPATRRSGRRGLRFGLRWLLRGALACAALILLALVFYAVFDPPGTPYMAQEKRRLGQIQHRWVPASSIAPVMLRSVVAAEDANFCRHAGFDMAAIRAAMRDGGGRGASTLSQQVVKNVFLWQGRSWPRKALEAVITPASELVWSKRRILELYLNVAEFGEGVFGIAAAAEASFKTTPDRLTAQQAAALAAVLPSPKTRSAARPTQFVQRRAAAIRDGAETIRADGRAACFER